MFSLRLFLKDFSVTLSGFLLAAILLSGCASKEQGYPLNTKIEPDQAYQYPIANPYASTIIGLPTEIKPDLSAFPAPVEEHLTVFKNRKVPEGFWYEKDLRYGELLQPHPAPLVFVIAGTGADHRAENMRSLGNAFYRAGFHVVLLPSTVHPNFIITASNNFTPGRSTESARDLYRVMKMINTRLASKVQITSRFLSGYSLGALDAAFTARLDEDEKALNFTKVLLINPPLSLYSSAQVIDRLLYEGLPHGLDDVDTFIDSAMAKLSTFSQSGDGLDFQNARLLMNAYNSYQLDDRSLATTIGLAFRLFAANMIFTADVMGNTGYIFPKNSTFTTSTSLNKYMSVALRTSLMDYFNDIYVPYYLAQDSSLSKETLVAESSLEYLAPYLMNNPKFGMVTNQDDIILAPGELAKLQQIFGLRAKIFPNGGHLGNLGYAPVAQYMVQFMMQGVQP